MAQYFYDMTICKPGEWPVFFKGNRPTLGSAVRAMGVNKGTPSPYFSQIKDNTETTHYVPTFGLNVANVEVLVKYKIPPFGSLSGSFNNTGPVGVFVRCTTGAFTSRPPTSYYCASGSTEAGYDDLALYKVDSPNSLSQTSVATQAGTISIPSFPGNIQLFAFMRMRINGTTLQVKHWLSSNSEPGTWNIDTTDASISASGDVGVYFSGYMGEVGISFVSIGTDGDAAPSSYPGGNRMVAGTVLDPTGGAAEGYLVRCYHRETGVIIGETLSIAGGAFSFSLPIPETEKVYCLAVDQLGNSWNAPINDLIEPA
jgi:hypothetical protein